MSIQVIEGDTEVRSGKSFVDKITGTVDNQRFVDNKTRLPRALTIEAIDGRDVVLHCVAGPSYDDLTLRKARMRCPDPSFNLLLARNIIIFLSKLPV